MEKPPQLLIDGLSVTFQDKYKSTPALLNIKLKVEKAEFISIIGPSGCGKTTLLKCISGLLPYKGIIELNGKIVTKPTEGTAMVFQDPLLLPWKKAIDNIQFGSRTQGKNADKTLRNSRRWVRVVGLKGFEHFYPNELSGGMRQRVNLARALVCNPEILLLDEPFANIDAINRQILINEIFNIWQTTGKTFIFVTHQIAEALMLSQRIIVMSKRPGKIIADIKVDAPYPREKSRFSKEFIAKEKLLSKLIENQIKTKKFSNARNY